MPEPRVAATDEQIDRAWVGGAPELNAAITLGYRLVIREPDWYQHRVLKGPDTDINLHVHLPDSPEIRRHLLFRDWLRAQEDDRDLYERTKRDLASRTWKYVQNYADAKTEVIETILAKPEAGSRCRA